MCIQDKESSWLLLLKALKTAFPRRKGFSALLSSLLVVMVTKGPKDSSADIQVFLPAGEEQEHYLVLTFGEWRKNQIATEI